MVVADLASARRGGEQTVQTINDAGGRAEYVACDVSNAEDNQALVAHVVARFGRLDFAHNNAGIGVHALLADTEDEDFDRVVAVNLRGTFLGMKHQIRQMLRNGGGAIVQHRVQRRAARCQADRRVCRDQARDPGTDQERRDRVRE